ncbi:MAG: chloride channel protein [Clostridia bacterium]|nr:chloride channel protein [Clostridia bacterium]
MLLEGIIIGLLTGAIVSLFRVSLEKAQQLRDWYIYASKNQFMYAILGIFIVIFIATVSYYLVKKVPLISGSGIPQVKGELRGQIKAPWLRVLVGKFAGGVLVIGGGLSLGREGPSIQLGAMIGKGLSKVLKRMKTEEKMMMTCGAGAGLAAAFNAPLAGVVFALEELHKNFSTEVLLTTMVATVSSDFVSSYIFGLKPVFNIPLPETLPLKEYWTVLILGVALGVLGVIYNWCIAFFQKKYDGLKIKAMKAAIPAIFVVVFAIFYPNVLGSGHALVEYVCNRNLLLSGLIVLFVLKFLFSMISFGSGAPGGIFLPLLVMGSVLGAIFSAVLGMDMYVSNYVILGMVGYFSAIVKAPITGVILITEMTGDFSNLLSLALVALMAYISSELLKGKPIYSQLLDRILEKQGERKDPKGEKVLLEADIYFGSEMDGAPLSKLDAPKGSLVVSVERDGREVVPNGSTILKGGDKIVVLCDEYKMSVVESTLERKCMKTRY